MTKTLCDNNLDYKTLTDQDDVIKLPALLLLASMLVMISFAISFIRPTNLCAHGTDLLNTYLYLKYLPYNTAKQKLAHLMLLALVAVVFVLLCLISKTRINLNLDIAIKRVARTYLTMFMSVFVFVFILQSAAELNLQFSDWFVQAYVLWWLAYK